MAAFGDDTASIWKFFFNISFQESKIYILLMLYSAKNIFQWNIYMKTNFFHFISANFSTLRIRFFD